MTTIYCVRLILDYFWAFYFMPYIRVHNISTVFLFYEVVICHLMNRHTHSAHALYEFDKKVKVGNAYDQEMPGAIRQKFPLQQARWEKTKLTISYSY